MLTGCHKAGEHTLSYERELGEFDSAISILTVCLGSTYNAALYTIIIHPSCNVFSVGTCVRCHPDVGSKQYFRPFPRISGDHSLVFLAACTHVLLLRHFAFLRAPGPSRLGPCCPGG